MEDVAPTVGLIALGTSADEVISPGSVGLTVTPEIT